MENFMPYITRKVFSQARKMTHTDDDDIGANDRSEEKQYLERVREEAELPEYDIYADYAEMVVQVPNPPTPLSRSFYEWQLMKVWVCSAMVGDLAHYPRLRSHQQLARTPFRRS
jgi:hypothetical protein